MILLIFLITREKKPPKKFKLDWVGRLSELKDQYTSVELQHKASEWRRNYVSP